MTFELLKRSAVIVAVGFALSACSALGTVVDENDPETEVPNLSMGRSIMESLGAVQSRSRPINYQPRAPLVVPPSTSALAAPEDPQQVESLAGWPDDPDRVTERRLREAAARDATRERGDPIASSELLATRAPPRASNDLRPSVDRDPGDPIMPSELMNAPKSLGRETSLYNENGQPQRRALVEPPIEYLQPAPGAPVEVYEAPDPKKKKGLFGWFSW